MPAMPRVIDRTVVIVRHNGEQEPSTDVTKMMIRRSKWPFASETR